MVLDTKQEEVEEKTLMKCSNMPKFVNKMGQEPLSSPENNIIGLPIVIIFFLIHLHLPKTSNTDKQDNAIQTALWKQTLGLC